MSLLYDDLVTFNLIIALKPIICICFLALLLLEQQQITLSLNLIYITYKIENNQS
jgi:hypothetical protein